MIEKIISGGQTGADQVALEVARRFEIATGGFMPLGAMTEDGPRPDLAREYDLVVLSDASYSARTAANVRASDATLWVGPQRSSGGVCTKSACKRLGKPFLTIPDADEGAVAEVAESIVSHGVRVLNVAGNRASGNPLIRGLTAEVLTALLPKLGHRSKPPSRAG